MTASQTAAAQHAGEAELARRMLASGCNPSLQNHYVGQRCELNPSLFKQLRVEQPPVGLRRKSAEEIRQDFRGFRHGLKARYAGGRGIAKKSQ
jgi:hypothetical protein